MKALYFTHCVWPTQWRLKFSLRQELFKILLHLFGNRILDLELYSLYWSENVTWSENPFYPRLDVLSTLTSGSGDKYFAWKGWFYALAEPTIIILYAYTDKVLRCEVFIAVPKNINSVRSQYAFGQCMYHEHEWKTVFSDSPVKYVKYSMQNISSR